MVKIEFRMAGFTIVKMFNGLKVFFFGDVGFDAIGFFHENSS